MSDEPDEATKLKEALAFIQLQELEFDMIVANRVNDRLSHEYDTGLARGRQLIQNEYDRMVDTIKAELLKYIRDEMDAILENHRDVIGNTPSTAFDPYIRLGSNVDDIMSSHCGTIEINFPATTIRYKTMIGF